MDLYEESIQHKQELESEKQEENSRMPMGKWQPSVSEKLH